MLNGEMDKFPIYFPYFLSMFHIFSIHFPVRKGLKKSPRQSAPSRPGVAAAGTWKKLSAAPSAGAGRRCTGPCDRPRVRRRRRVVLGGINTFFWGGWTQVEEVSELYGCIIDIIYIYIYIYIILHIIYSIYSNWKKGIGIGFVIFWDAQNDSWGLGLWSCDYDWDLWLLWRLRGRGYEGLERKTWFRHDHVFAWYFSKAGLAVESFHPNFHPSPKPPTVGSPKRHRNTSEKNGIRIQVWVQTWQWMKMDENGWKWWLFPTFNAPQILSSQVSWDSEPCRPWAFGVRGWIPFELRSNRWDDWSSRAPAPGGKFQGKTRFLRQFFMRYYL